MLKNDLKIAFRSLFKNKFFSALNILGLTVGLAGCTLVGLFIFEEIRFDRHHERALDLYRVGTVFLRPNATVETERENASFATPAPLGDGLKLEFGEIEKAARLQKVFSHAKTPMHLIEHGEVKKVLNEPLGYFADSTFFELFRYEFLEGDGLKALAEPNSLVISEEIALKMFGTEPALGRVLRVSNSWFDGGEGDLKITGVFRQTTAPSHLDGRFFMSMNSGEMGRFVAANTSNFLNNNMFSTYIRLQKGCDSKGLETKMTEFIEKRTAADSKKQGYSKRQFLVKVPDVHLSGIGQTGDRFVPGSKKYLFLLGGIAAFGLLIACINFMNLSTACSARRAAEVGIRKSVGAGKTDLIRQFLGESLLISMISWVASLGLARLVLPFFNKMIDRNLSFSLGENAAFLLGFFGLALLVGILAGVYPAFYLSSFRPMDVLKGKISGRWSAVFLRKGMVVFQFSISTVLILASLVIHRQLRFMNEADLGFEKTQQIMLPLMSKSAIAAYPSLKNEFARMAGVERVGASMFYPGILNASDGSFRREGQSVEKAVMTRRNFVDTDFLKTLGVEAVAGRLFSPEFSADTSFRIILNEKAAKEIGFASPQEAVGQKIQWNFRGQDNAWQIVGVVKNFHFENLHEPIKPYSFELSSARQPLNYLIARAGPGSDLSSVLSKIEAVWKRVLPGEPLEYSFLDQDFAKNYRSDRQISSLVGGLTGIAILISCLGLFGLAAFAAERRVKEIGIRKTLGATVASLHFLLAKDFLKLVVVAVLIASPVAYFLMEKWLADFAFRIKIGWEIFAVAGLAAVGMAFLTVSFQAVKAAVADPVKSLRSE